MREENMTENEKNEFGKSLQQKCNNIRTSFSRELKRRAGAKSGSAALRKSPYVYFEHLQFLKETVVDNRTQDSLDETDVAESNYGGCGVHSLLPKKKQKNNDERLIAVLQQSIELREERERNQESDSDRLFLLSLLEDMKKISEQRKLTIKMEITEVKKRAQMLPLRTHHQGYSDYASETTVAGAIAVGMNQKPRQTAVSAWMRTTAK
ncbi:uncharacterized protein LOC124722389 [Schistocerca piceifrons]|uniref:uncharacterized protein LOC124722389 n=1 Tax=Schistocerca piceifrons TaxID=274613 RepID=UPI001F5E4ACD|nr:uncharacterized protein LOC124722389 [Schistocerca piceifrons]